MVVAATVFFFFDAMSVAAHRKTSLHVGMIVPLIAGAHYFYTHEYWVTIMQTPIVNCYIDWSLTVPLQMVEFYFIPESVIPDLISIMFWRLLVATVVMLAFCNLGEQSIVKPWGGFAIGMAGWFFILFEIFVLYLVNDAGPYVASACSIRRFVAAVGWSFYLLDYYFGHFVSAVDVDALNLVGE